MTFARLITILFLALAPLRAADLRAAIAAARPGDTIRVRPGVYEGNLVLDKSLILLGEERPVLRGDGRSSVVTVTAPNCTIRGFVIEKSGPMLVDEDSGVLLRSDGNRILDNDLRDVLFGVYFFHSNRNIIRGNTIRGRAWLEPGERGSGLHFWNSAWNVIEDNTITAMRDGMYLQNLDHSQIRRNRISDLRYGLHYMYSNDNIFEDNVFERNVAGAAIMYSARIQFRRNQFIHNRGFSSFGLLFQDSEDCVAEHNVISDNTSGLFLEAVRNSVFRENLIAANDVAVEMFSSADQNVFTRNNFIANLTPIRLIGRSSTTRWSDAGTGNYWSDYDGYDMDGDGVGDVPFRIQNLYEHLEGNFPRLRIYFYSPASQALVAAERAFPIVRGSREQDPRPLMRPVPLPVAAPREGRPRRGPVVSIALLLVAGFVLRRGVSR